MVGLLGLEEGEAAVDGRKSVVDEHLGPFAAPPDAETEDARVLLAAEGLVRGDHSVEEALAEEEDAEARHQPLVA